MNTPHRHRRITHLTKSRFSSGWQCLKRLWLECYQPDLVPPMDAVGRYRAETGRRVGALARQRFGRNVLVEATQSFSAAVRETQRGLADPKVLALCEPAFLHDGVAVRADILTRSEQDGWDLIEVKSTSAAKEEHILDIAIQAHVLRQSGLHVNRMSLMHLDSDYVYEGGDYDLDLLFSAVELNVEVEAVLPEIPSAVSEMKAVLREGNPPDIPVGNQCKTPRECPFLGCCNADCPENPVTELPRASKRLLASLRDEGIETIPNIPDGFPGLTPTQERVRNVVISGKPYLDRQIRDELKQVEYPIHFLDFETFMPALPLFPGTSPYQTIPFQWSDHVMQRDGSVEHHEFLHDGHDDPRPAFVESLLEVLGRKGSIVVYSPYEARIIRELADVFPEKADRLETVLCRLFDLLPLVRKYVYHPSFHGSFSIKSVLPALVVHAGYDDLEIADGLAASVAYEEMISRETASGRREEIRTNLLRYCERDTEAMVWLRQSLS